MNDSFLFKFAGNVDKDNLARVGEMVFSAKAGSVKHIAFTTREVLSFRLVGDGYFTLTSSGASVGKEYEFPVSSSVANLYCHATDDCTVFIKDNYTAIRSIDFFNLDGDVSQLNFRNDFINFAINSGGELTGEITQSNLLKSARIVAVKNSTLNMDLSVLIGNTYITNIDFDSYSVESNISSLAGLTTLTNITMVNCRKIVGNISSLGNLINLTVLSMNASSLLQGDIAGLFVTWLNNGKTSGTVTITAPASTLLFNNLRLNGAKVTFSSDSIVVKDSANNTLGTYDGTWHYN